MKNARMFAVIGLGMLFSLVSCSPCLQREALFSPLKKMGGYKIVVAWEPGATRIATAFQKGMISISEGKARTTIKITLKPLEEIARVKVGKGIVDVRMNRHRYRIYPLLAGQCTKMSMQGKHILQLDIIPHAIQYDHGVPIIGGKYGIYMVEDGLVTWHWCLIPSSEGAIVPKAGGFDPGEAFLMSETLRLENCSDSGERMLNY